MRIRLLAIIPAVVLLSAFQDGAAVTSPWVGNRAVTNTAQQPAFIKDEHLKPLVGARVSHPFANQMPKLRVVGAAQANAAIPAVDLSNAFITRPYLGQHIATSIFDHCNPDYSVDGRICDSDGFVALSSNGVDPSFSKGYAYTRGGSDYVSYDGHNGWDLPLYYENVRAAAGGTVQFAGNGPGKPRLGETTTTYPASAIATPYAHLDAIFGSARPGVGPG